MLCLNFLDEIVALLLHLLEQILEEEALVENEGGLVLDLTDGEGV